MDLVFERGDRGGPVGHALIYFQADSGAVLATYVSVPPIQFDLTNYVPGFLAGALQGMDLGDAMVAAPMPPIPEQVDSVDYLRALAARRQDDLVFAGRVGLSDPMRLAAEAAEAARAYGELYGANSTVVAEPVSTTVTETVEVSPFADLSEGDRLKELTMLTGRLQDSLNNGTPDSDIERQMQQLAGLLPAKYRVGELIDAARQGGDRGRKLAGLYLERCYKLFNEDYLDLERIDREIEAARG